jgi:hypothetical protein
VAGTISVENPHGRLIHGRIILKYFIGFHQSIARQQVSKHVPVNKKQCELYSFGHTITTCLEYKIILKIEKGVF